MIQITNRDKKLITQNIIELRFKIEIYDENNRILDVLDGGIVGGSSAINAESDITRTFSINVIPNRQFDIRIKEHNLIWINRKVKLCIGINDKLRNIYVWFPQGEYVFTNTSITYDAITNQVSVNCSDMVSKLNGTKNGQLGQSIIKYPAYIEDETTGEVIKYNYIRDQVITTLTQLAKITDYNIDDIGEYKAMPQYNDDWEKYRKESKVKVKDGTLMETWNATPFDQEFSSGCNVWNILTTFRDLYPNYEMFFDENGTFVCQMIPSCYDDDIILDNDFLQSIYISENTNIDLSTIRNICEVWGESIEADFYADSSSYTNNIYSCSINGYEEKYYNGDNIAIRIATTNSNSPKLKVNEFVDIDIYDDNTEKPLEANKLEANEVYVFKIRKKHIDGSDVIRAYLLGHYQAHGINVLTNGTVGEDFTTTSGKVVSLYSLEYFKEVYGCEDVEFTIIEDSPFTVQKLGEILDVKTGGEYENITSTSLALHRAEWENWKNTRLTDNINLTTKICPFLDVNIKVSYKRHDEDDEKQYIIKSISHDFSGGTSNINMIRFYPLYVPEEERKTWENIGKISWGKLSGTSWEDLKVQT